MAAAGREAIGVMVEMQDYSGAMGQSSLEEPMLKEAGGAADKRRQLKIKWERACFKYEAALKIETATAKPVCKTARTKSAAQRALTSLVRIKQEIDQFVLENETSKEKTKELFFVGMINFARR